MNLLQLLTEKGDGSVVSTGWEVPDDWEPDPTWHRVGSAVIPPSPGALDAMRNTLQSIGGLMEIDGTVGP